MENIGFVTGNGTSTSVSNYKFVDNPTDVLIKRLYYRLKQIDYDGFYEYSDIVAINYTQQWNSETVNIFPNPATDYITLEINEPTSFQIITAQGQVIVERSLSTTERLDISSLSVGNYWLRAINGNGFYVQPLVVMKGN